MTRPIAAENAWRNLITAALKANGIVASQLSFMQADYVPEGGHLYLMINSVTYIKSGERKNVSIRVSLPDK